MKRMCHYGVWIGIWWFSLSLLFAAPASTTSVSKVAAVPLSNTGLAVPTSGVARIYPETELVKAGQPAAVIVYSGTDTATAEAAKHLGAALKSRLGVEFPAVADTTLCSNVMARVPEEYRKQNLIVVGNLHNNRIVFPLYAVFLCGADCEFPGDDGYELRTISNPWGTGKNVLLIGGSTPAGVQAGVAAFLTNLPPATAANVTIARLHAIKPGKAIQAKFKALSVQYPYLQFKRPDQFGNANAEACMFSRLAFNYHWTGDPRWAVIARDVLNYLNEIYAGYYPVGHYDAEQFFRAWDLIEEAPVFTDAERQITGRRILETAYRVWHIGNTGGAGFLGDTHGTMCNMAQWTATRYLQRTFWDEPELLKALAPREAALRDHYQAAISGFSSEDDAGGIPTSFGLFLRWSAMEQEPAYLESGNARQGLLYIATYYDSLGCLAGIGMYGEARPGTMRKPAPGVGYWSASYTLRLAAFVYQDPELAQLARRFTEYGPVDLWGVMDLSLFGAGTYPTPPTVKTKPPALADGLSVIPFDQRRYHLWNTGMPTRGVPINQRMPLLERMYDKICFRTGYDAQDQYLLLQGLLFACMDANTIARYTDQGQIWLTHNSSQIGPFVRNGMFISDGLNDRQVQSGCRLDAAGRFDDFAMISSTLLDFYESDWQRVIFWKPGGWFVVMDRAVLAKAGQYAGQSIWRMPPIPGTWDAGARRLTVLQNGKKFCIQAGETLPVRAGFEAPESGPPDIYENPFMLRQYKSGFYPARRVLDFQNLLTVTEATNALAYTITRLNDSAALVRGLTGDVCIVGAGGAGTGALGLDAEGGIFAITPREIYVAGVRILRLDGEIIMDAPYPVSARIDLQTGAVSAGYDQAQLREAAATWKLKPAGVPMGSWSAEKAKKIAQTIAHKLAEVNVGGVLHTATVAAHSAPPTKADISEKPQPEAAPLKMSWESLAAGFHGKPPDGLAVAKAENATGEPSALVDHLIPRLCGGMLWPGTNSGVVELNWARPESIAEIRVYNGPVSHQNRPDEAQRCSADRAIGLAWSSDGFKNDLRQQTVMADKEIGVYPTYKSYVVAHEWLRVPFDVVSASGVRLTVPISTNNSWQVNIAEIEVWTTNRGPLGIDQLAVADLEGKGKPDVILSTTEPRLVVLKPDGKLRWQKTFTGRIPSVIAADINGDGKKEIVCCSYDLNIYAFAADGRELWKTSFVELVKKTGGKMGLGGETPFAVGFWEPRPGLRRIVVGQYANKSVMLDEHGKILDSVGMAGYFARQYFGQADLNGDGIEELCLSSIRYYGSGTIYVHIVDREGQPIEKVGHTEIIGGTPLVSRLLKDKPGYAAIIAPGGVGVYNLNLAEEKYGGVNALWESRNRPLSAGLLYDVDGNGADELLAGGRDGFVTTYSTDGVPLRVALIGEEVTGLLAFGVGETLRYVVATPSGLRVYDSQWKLQGVHSDAYARLNLFDNARQTFIAVTDDARVQLWSLQQAGGWGLSSK